jgi:hypothetical protein
LQALEYMSKGHLIADVVTIGRQFAVIFDSNQSRNFLEFVGVTTFLLIFVVRSKRAFNIRQRLFVSRLTNLTLCLDPINGRVREVKTFNRILNVLYLIMLRYITAQTYECSKRVSVLYSTMA